MTDVAIADSAPITSRCAPRYVVVDIYRDYDPESLEAALRRARLRSFQAVRTAWVAGQTFRLIATWKGTAFEVLEATEAERVVIASIEADPLPPTLEGAVRFITAGGSGAPRAS